MSAEQLITDRLDLWTGAVTYKSGRGAGKGRELTGIKKLRELILELAVRGKLIEQDPNDEPASVLLERIAEEKARLVQEGKVRKSQGSTDKAAIENSFDTNKGWIKTTLSNVGYWAIGNGFPKQEQGQVGEEVLFCKVSDMNLTDNHKEILSTTSTVSHETAKRLKLNLHPAGTIVFPKIGGAISTNKRRRVVKPTAIDNNCLGVIPSCGISSDYLFLFLTSVDMAEYQAGTSVPALSQNVLGKIVIRLPPLEEQHRIVAMVDELMALCDRLGQQIGDQLDAHEVLVDTLLDALIRAEDADEVAAQWARLAEHFDTLFTTDASIDKLKQAILQLAVMGRLVEQDPNDEPADTLLARLGKERQKWLEDTQDKNPESGAMIRKLKKLNSPHPPFDLPEGWKAAHLIQLSKILVDCHNKTAPYVKDGIPIIRTSNVRERKFRLHDLKHVSNETYEYWSRRCPPEPQDIIFTREAPMGEAAIIPEGAKWCLGQRTMLIRPMLDHINEEYLLLTLTEPSLLRRATEKAIGSTVKHLRVGDVEKLAIPVPPLGEQDRIVKRANKLMALCDQLKTRLSDAGETRTHLAEAVVTQAVE